ncbi:hypothetical protein CF392_11975 [Tamilnaduibacter salinus]|uniref:Sulfatase-modifying factor enzyme-like domain-containing protein n=1 Tax=Tamilnaduibacter salinus TaxID=1484056 RepID=A0A2A2I0S3_9GAMM|nr:SUMF1/EgtB/PvdO family nonheme iron enzyme [Tamilnaduibacter salinus]PAV25247.1 hypothetical protein CF392_11975 [Tamilnaduibacter salinus]
MTEKLIRRVLILSIFSSSLAGCGLVGDWAQGASGSQIERIVKQAREQQVFIKGGTFMMGDVGILDGEPYVTLTDSSRPPFKATLDSYSISKYETTWAEMVVYLRDVGRLDKYDDSESRLMAVEVSDDPMSPHFARKPARAPNYREAKGYCRWVADQTGLPFALPTEAQWEYAARSRGKDVPYATNTGKKDNDTYLQRPLEHIDPSIPPSGNMLSHSSLAHERRPVGSYPPNPIGLHDMSGNVSEWTRDWYWASYYRNAPSDNPAGPDAPLDPSEPQKTVRDWAGRGSHSGGSGTVFSRGGETLSSSGNGFRCVVNQPTPVGE